MSIENPVVTPVEPVPPRTSHASASETSPVVFSVIIPTLNEEKYIGQCLGALSHQMLPPDRFEVIVVDNGSTDRTLEVISQGKSNIRTTVLRKPKCNVSEARNAAAARAKGSFLVFLDSDCLVSSDWLQLALNHLRRGDGGVIGAFYTIPKDSTWVAKSWYGDMAIGRRGAVSYVPSGCLFIDRCVFHNLRGFDPAIQTSEDFEFCQRVAAAGYQVLSYPELSVLHLGTPQTVQAFYRKQRWHGTGIRTVFGRKLLERGFLKTIIYTALMSAGLALIALGLPTALITRNVLAVALPVGFVLLISLMMAVKAAARRRNFRLVLPLTLLFTVYGAARSVSLLGLVGRRDRRVAIPQSHAATAD